MDQRPIFNTVHSINQVTFAPDVNSIEASAHGHLQIEIPAESGIYQANIQSKEPNEELNVVLFATNSAKGIAATHLISGTNAKYGRTIDIIEDYRKKYNQ